MERVEKKSKLLIYDERKEVQAASLNPAGSEQQNKAF